MLTEEWDRTFLRALPVISTGLGVISVAIALMTLRSRAMSSRAYYHEDGRYLVSVRYPGQWHDIRDFVQPANPDVVALYHQYADYWSLYDFVCREISYRRDTGEFWLTPSETLARRRADCEDTSILLTSLIRAGGTPVYVSLGTYQGYGHAWCEYRGEILESTFTSARRVPDPQNYVAYARFNESSVEEAWPGGLGEIFDVPRDEATKLDLMAGVGNVG